MIEKISIIISIISAFIAIKAWHKSRAVYGVELETIQRIDPYNFDRKNAENNVLNKKLIDGNYSLISVMKGKGVDQLEMVFGRIKPYPNPKYNLSEKSKDKLAYSKFLIINKKDNLLKKVIKKYKYLKKSCNPFKNDFK